MLVQFNLIDRKGSKISIEAEEGTTIKDAIMDKLSPGNFALCGGSCICATCHVYVKEDWYDKLPKKDMGEDDMLDQAYEPNSNSRLSCQIMVSDDLDGLSVYMPEKQV